MYHIEDKSSAIKEIQKMLSVNETGNCDEKTRASVLELQRLKGLASNGVVDYNTYTVIREEYERRKRRENVFKSSVLRDNAFPYELGSHGHDVTILNGMLANQIEKYSLPLWKPRGSFYSKATAFAVEFLREVFYLEGGRCIDELFYEKLSIW